MKGLALILSKGKPPMGKSKEEGAEEEAPESEPGDGAAKRFARLASEAIADGDHDAAADALVSMAKACKY